MRAGELAALGMAVKMQSGLALQGDGAHGAFTWGVLDALLEHPRIRFEKLSGSIAGAMNAVVFADGRMKGGRDGARQSLADFWTEVGKQMPSGMVTQGRECAGQALGPFRRLGSRSTADMKKWIA